MARWNFKNRKEGSTESKEAEECPEIKNDPRVRSFVRNYEPCINQTDPEVILLTHSKLRYMFNAYPSQTGYDPLIRILNQLENEGFQMDVALGKDEFVLPVKKKIILNMLGYGEDL